MQGRAASRQAARTRVCALLLLLALACSSDGAPTRQLQHVEVATDQQQQQQQQQHLADITQPRRLLLGPDPKHKASSKSSYVPPAFNVTSVSLDVSFRPPKVFVNNTMVVAPASSASCKPRRHAAAAADGVAARLQRLLPGASGCSSVCTQALELSARGLEILSIELNGRRLAKDEYEQGKHQLAIFNVPACAFTLRIHSSMEPPADPRVEQGLYQAGKDGLFATHFEPYGLSRVTPYIDRPDVLPLWTVRLEGDEATLPVLLSNGQVTSKGKLPGGRHFVVWKDPRPKPSYQVSITAGKLAVKQDMFHSCLTGTPVRLLVYVPPAFLASIDFALYSLQAAMAWHEAAWGVPYKSDTYTMVGVPGFDGEAAEASQMGVFDTAFLAATPATRTDRDAESILRLVGHEFFHTWSGNYVTVRDFNDLTLKEGLTTYMEQAFAADLDTAESIVAGVRKPLPPALTTQQACKGNPAAGGNATKASAGGGAHAGMLPLQQVLAQLRAVASCRGGRGGCQTPALAAAAASEWRRIPDVAFLRKAQVPEDDGDSPHPLRLTSSSKMGTPYTNTIYRKGAELISMYRELMGPVSFGKGLYTWFTQHYGKAGSIDEFYTTMSAASLGALPPTWMAWYEQPGTPWVELSGSFNRSARTLTLALEQGNAVTESGYTGVKFQPLPIPMKVGLLQPNGQQVALQLQHPKPGSRVTSYANVSTGLLLLTERRASFVFTGVQQPPVISPLRRFSAPVRAWVTDQTPQDLSLIARADPDMFARWNAVYRLLYRLTLLELYNKAIAAKLRPTDTDGLQTVLAEAGDAQEALGALVAAYKALLPQQLPGGTKGYMLAIADVSDLQKLVDDADPLLMARVRAHVGRALARQLKPLLLQVIARSDAAVAALPARGFVAPAMNARLTANMALKLLAFNWDARVERLALARYKAATTLSDVATTLQLLVSYGSPKVAAAALADFKRKAASSPAAKLQWLRILGASEAPGSTEALRQLLRQPGGTVDLRSGEQVEALLGEGFASQPATFHAADGSGYKLLADAILQVDKVNPEAAAMLLRRAAGYKYLPGWAKKGVRAQLARLAKQRDSLSGELRGTLAWVYTDGDDSE